MHFALRLFTSSFILSCVIACSENDGASNLTEAAKIELAVSLSSRIPTVARAEWSTSVLEREQLRKATFHYILDSTGQELLAPVDLDADFVADKGELTFATSLLGMKQLSDYTVYVEVETTAGTVVSAQVSVRTGSLPPRIPRVTIEQSDASKLYGGFTVACTGPGGGEAWAFIWDRDGDIVWAHSLLETDLDTCTRARLSYDGRSLWVGDLNLGAARGALAKLDMRGEQPMENLALTGRHHDFAILPNGNLLYFKQEVSEDAVVGGKRDVIYELDPTTLESHLIYDELADFGAVIGEMPAHTNYIAFVPHLSAISFSMLLSNTIALVSYPEGKLLATFGGVASDFEMSWTKQHGHQLTQDKLLVFSNQGPNLESIVLEYEVDLAARTSQPLSDYVSEDQTATFGDVRRLPNGNLLVTYSNAGAIHELTPDWTLLRRTATVGLGYVEHRRTLYGPPPPFVE